MDLAASSSVPRTHNRGKSPIVPPWPTPRKAARTVRVSSRAASFVQGRTFRSVRAGGDLSAFRVHTGLLAAFGLQPLDGGLHGRANRLVLVGSQALQRGESSRTFRAHARQGARRDP